MAQNQRKGNVPRKSGGNTVFYAVLGVIALAGLVIIGYALLGGRGGSAATELVDLDVADARALYDQATPIRLGQPDAPVKIIEFGDFQCPACGSFSLQVRPAIVDQFVKTGQAQFTYYDFPLVSIHDHAVLSARAARCAGAQELTTPPALEGIPGEVNAAYWVYHDKLYEEQSRWAFGSGSVQGDFVRYAGEVGLDEGEFESCLRSDQFADVVSANYMLAMQLRLSGTPTVIVNNQRIDNPTAANLRNVIQSALQDGSGSMGSGG